MMRPGLRGWEGSRTRLALVGLLLSGLAGVAGAHETDHFTPPRCREFAELGPTFTRDFHNRIVKAVDDANRQIDLAAGWPSHRAALRRPRAVARAVCVQFGLAGFYIDEVDRFVQAPTLKAEFPGRLTAHRATPSIYDEALLPIDFRQFYLLWRGSVFVIDGVYVSSDKIGHFIHHGYNYYQAYHRALERGATEADARYQAVLEVGVGDHVFFSEWRLLGALTSGVVSNADLAANYIGMLFYINLTEEVMLRGRPQPPMLRVEDGYWRLNPHVRPDSDFLTRFFAPHFDEALNPNFYDALTAEVLDGVIGRRCATLRRLYVDENGAPLGAADFLRLREALRSYYGEPYGHTGLIDGNVVSIANGCFCDAEEEGLPGPAALRQAVRRGDEATVAALLGAGVDPDLPAEAGERTPAALRGQTVLHAAARAGERGVVRQLIAAGAEVNATTAREVTPLHFARTGPIAAALLDAGADVHARDTTGRAPLHWASRAGRVEVVDHLLAAGADRNATDCDDETALHIAARAGHDAVSARLLRNGSRPDAAALYATTPLHLATRQGHGAVVAQLLAAGANPDAADLFGCTPLHEAAVVGDAELAAMLTEAGADPRVEDALGHTPMAAAVRLEQADVVRVLERALAAAARDEFGRAAESTEGRGTGEAGSARVEGAPDWRTERRS